MNEFAAFDITRGIFFLLDSDIRGMNAFHKYLVVDTL